MADRSYLENPGSTQAEASPLKAGQNSQPVSKPNTASYVLQQRWEIIKQLGQGGMGTVYLARDLRLSNRLCVVKRLRVDFFREEDRQQALAFFQREAMVLSSLKHPNIVLIHDYFEEDENYYLVMEYVEGENLQAKLSEQNEPFSEHEVLDWAIKICEVLHYLHKHNPPVIYRDLKPSNIMVDSSGTVKLVDFGIARPYAEESDNTHVVSGGYSPPEQYWGGADPRSDLYGLGATMHFLLTGSEPLALQTSSPQRVNPHISAHLDEVVQRATAQDVWLRYQSAMEMLAALKVEPRGERAKLGSVFSLISLIALVCALIFSAVTTTKRPVQHAVTEGTIDSGPFRDSVVKPALTAGKAKGDNKPKHPAGSAPPETMESKLPDPVLPSSSISPLESQPPEAHNYLTSYAPSVDAALADSREESSTDPEGIEPIQSH